MRPVQLDIDGFASFRDPTVIDFADTDYFVLVGPTGSGKSTVIDAMTFALYGSAPRWSDRRAVFYGLAPSTTRATVRLIFDAAGRRYAVARELRRTKAGVNIRNVRLDQFVDPLTTDFDNADVVSVAADGAVSKAVEELLGLSFEHFCQCVVLPQGQFSDFLRASRRQRQEILLNLLGADLYDRIRSLANQRAAVAQSRTALLDDQLVRLGDATDDAVAAAAARVELLTRFGSDVADLLEELAQANTRLAAGRQVVDELDAELRQLEAVRVPDGLQVLESARSTSAGDLALARESATRAESVDSSARTGLAGSPRRVDLERLRDDHRRLTALTHEVPELAAQAAAATDRQHAAVVIREQAVAQVTSARTARDAAVRDAQDATSAVQAMRAERAMVLAVAVPATAAELDAGERAAAAALETAVDVATRADAADRRAAEAVQALPARAPLEQTFARYQRLTAALARRDSLAASADRSAAMLLAGTESRQAAEARQATHRAAVEHARNENTAATLRPLLVVGDACPVCAQPVHDLPPALVDAGLTDVESGLRSADAELAAARTAESTAAADAHAARALLDGLDTDIADLRATVHGQPTPDEVLAELADIDRLTEEAALARTAVRLAGEQERVARQRLAEVAAGTTAAWVTLRSARESVLSMQPPPVDEVSLLAAWQRLASWADEVGTERGRRLPDAETGAIAAEAARIMADGDLEAAQRGVEEAFTAETEATSLARLAQEGQRRAGAELSGLATRLAGEPPAAQVEADLVTLDGLEAAARTADAALLVARRVLVEAESRSAGVVQRYAAAWDDLRTARDRLVGLGAPAPAGESVSDAWASLLRWAEQAGAARTTKLTDARVTVTQAQEGVSAAEDGLRTRFADAGIAMPDDDPARTAAAKAAAAGETARRDHEDLVHRRAESQRISAERGDEQTRYQVSHKLDTMLRSSQFPEWLEAAALDTLVVDASASLTELSNGQFSLTHRDGEFYVVDHADADLQRSVRTLSGGETFQASLALALALSSQLSAIAVGGAAQLDSIFLDEGFGTLDADSLELVAETLENLTKGDRMVGVITHVAALADRIPVRFTVSRDNRSSRLVREGP